MPFFRTTNRSRRMGFQTFSRAKHLPAPLKDVELEYLDIRDWYMKTVGAKTQCEEALEQAKRVNNAADIKLYGERIKGFDGVLTDKRQRVRDLGERSFAEAYLLAAETMLPLEIRLAITGEAERLLGRPRHELTS